MPQRASDHATVAFAQAERRLFAACGVQVTSRRVRMADPPVAVRVLEAGDGPPLVLVHGSGMSASTWAPLMPYLGTRRLIAFDLPGFGLSDAFDYSGRSLREHAVAQLTSLLDALDLERPPVVGTSLGGMWALCLALDAPQRVAAVASLGSPPSRCPACTVIRSSPCSPHPACASSSRDPLAERRDDTSDGGPRRDRPSRRRASARGFL